MPIRRSSNFDTDKERAEETYPLIGLVCLTGIFLHLFVSEPIMYLIGFHYADEDNSILEKQHFGTYVIFLSFIMLLWRHGNPGAALVRLYRSERIYTAFFMLYMLIFTYMTLRSGLKGISFIIDTQICAIVAVLVLCRTPASYCRRAVYLFIAFTVVNSLIGIGEGIANQRLFTFDPTSSVMMDKTFRASSYLGHPLNNAMFTAVMLFVVLGVRLSVSMKTLISTILCVSLVASGGRSGLLFSCLGLLALGIVWAAKSWSAGKLTLFQIILLVAGIMVVPAGGGLGLYALISSNMVGERLSKEGDFADSSAESRILAWQVFNYMKPEEILFGMAPARTTEIRDEMSQSIALSLIENPWLLMFMHLGLVVFTVWSAGMIALIVRLTYRTSFALKLAVLSYFCIASTNNSFGVKGSLHLLIISCIVCASRWMNTESHAA